MALVRSILFSILASLLATMVAHRLLPLSEPLGDGGGDRPQGGWTPIIVIPILVGNSNNRIGWVKEVHHHHHHRLFRRWPAR